MHPQNETKKTNKQKTDKMISWLSEVRHLGPTMMTRLMPV